MIFSNSSFKSQGSFINNEKIFRLFAPTQKIPAANPHLDQSFTSYYETPSSANIIQSWVNTITNEEQRSHFSALFPLQRHLVFYEDKLMFRVKSVIVQIIMLIICFFITFFLNEIDNVLVLMMLFLVFLSACGIRIYLLHPSSPPGYRPLLYLFCTLINCICVDYFFLLIYEEKEIFYFVYIIRLLVQAYYVICCYWELSFVTKVTWVLLIYILGMVFLSISKPPCVGDLYRMYLLILITEFMSNARNFIDYFGFPGYPKSLPLLNALFVGDVLTLQTFRNFITAN